MKRFFLILLSEFLMFSTGCSQSSLFSNYRPIEQLQLVHTIGFDLHGEGLELSVCGGEGGEQGLTRLSCTGRNISECLAKLQNYGEKTELYFAHTRYILVGEDYARQGLGDVMQYLESSTQLRSDLPLFVVKGGTAKEAVLKSGGKEQGIHHVLEAVMRECAQQGSSYPFTCGDIGSFSAEYGSALACALTISKTKSADPQAEDEEVTPLVAGYAVMDLGTLCAFLSPDAARCVNLLIGEAGTAPMTIEAGGQPVSLRITQAKPTLLPTFHSDGTMESLTVQLQLEAVTEETEQDAPADPRLIGDALTVAAEQWLQEILVTMRDTQCDFLGFGPRMAIEEPQFLTDTPIPWKQQLKELTMEAQAACTVHHSEHEEDNA